MEIDPKNWYLLEEYRGWPLCSLDDFMFARADHFSKLVGTNLDSILVFQKDAAYMFINKRKWEIYKNYFSTKVERAPAYFENIYRAAPRKISKWRALNAMVARMYKKDVFDKRLFNSWRSALLAVALVGQPMNFVEFGEPRLTIRLKKYLSSVVAKSNVESNFVLLTNPFRQKQAVLRAKKIGINEKYARLFRLVRTVMLSKNDRYKIFGIYKNTLLSALETIIGRPVSGKYSSMTIEEILSSVRSHKTLRSRQGIVYTNGEREDINLGVVNKLIQSSVSEKSDQMKEIKGQCAMIGKVKGKVTVLLTAKDLKRMRKGNIVVAHTTTVDLMPAMRIAAGIITDMGGITSHAAIVSRELGIPCVIGTTIATEVFKDGDKVEVDATKGIVRKI